MKRSLGQNALMWRWLGEISKQLQWSVNGRMQWLDPDDFKDIISAGLKKEQRIAAGFGGGFVLLGQRTSKMSVEEMTQMLEFIPYFAAENGVKLSAEDYSAYPEAKAVQMVQRADNQ